MNTDDPSSRTGSRNSWLKRLIQPFCSEPETRKDITELIRHAGRQNIVDGDALTMLEGVLAVSDLRVRDIMIPRAEMVVLKRGTRLKEVLPIVIKSAHSRFPVIGDDKGEITGIVLAKDLLQYCGQSSKKFRMRDVLRSAVVVPESKRLNVLLKEFRTNRNHMAIVIDEYGSAAGLVTIEDVLEQIVGEIEDEHDFEEESPIIDHKDGEYTVKALIDIEEFNDYFHASFDTTEFDTIGGLVTNAIGHLPKPGEKVKIKRFHFRVIRSDGRRIHLLSMRILQKDATTD